MAVLVLMLTATSAQAQVYKEVNKSPGKRLDTLLKDIERGIQKTGESLSELLSLDAKGDTGLVEIDGARYMPLCTTDRFAADSLSMRQTCRGAFLRRYDAATVVSVTMPQEGWQQTVVMENKKVAKYKRRAVCYVLAKDGADGYINARYAFEQCRCPGGKWERLEGHWPKLERVDAIPNAHYKRLLGQ